MQDAINDVIKPSEPAKSGKIPQETYHDLKEMRVLLDNIQNLENQIIALEKQYDDTEKRVVQSLFDSGVFSISAHDNPVLVDDILVTCEWCDGYALGLQKVVKPEIEKS
jgi:hypothetical protein